MKFKQKKKREQERKKWDWFFDLFDVIEIIGQLLFWLVRGMIRLISKLIP
ncbi:hypothetical protein [Bacillus rubiinfantis]|nr:hypothetical protein [Bacillus rubiinfantis]